MKVMHPLFAFFEAANAVTCVIFILFFPHENAYGKELKQK